MSLPAAVSRALGACLLGLTLTSAALAQSAPALSLKRGVNALGYDPIWKDPAQARFQLRHLQAMKDAGFDHVRLNLHAFEHMDAEHRLSAAWWKTLDSVLDAAAKAGLQVLVDEHNFNECAQEQDLAPCRVKLKAFWRQVSERLRAAPASVVFEILNEPNRAMDAVWNEVLAENLQIIRETNPTRRVVVGPKVWNSLGELDNLKLPEADRNLVVTFHYYTPMEFTHQGAHWTPEFKNLKGITWGTQADHDRLKADFDKVKAWADKHGRPILLGEFGALESAAMPLRAAWTAAVARAAEARGFGWSYWQFDSDFVVWDMKADGWVKPILDALMSAPAPAPVAVAPAAPRDPVQDAMINTPDANTWGVYGNKQTSERVPCEAMGNRCLRVKVQERTTNAWEIGATAPIKGAIRNGDRLQFLIFGRLVSGDPNATATVNASIQLASAPYTSVISGPLTLSTKFEPLVIQGKATENFAEGTTSVSVQLGHLTETVELSAPVVLRNYKAAPTK